MKHDVDTPELRKARGAFFTPPEVAQFLTDWGVRHKADRVLEPSCGDAAFLLPAALRFLKLGAPKAAVQRNLLGHELHENSAAQARSSLLSAGVTVTVDVGDFFERPANPEFDAVIGNPPYIRYQSFSGPMRSRALESALRQGVRLSQLASSWAHFTIHATSFLKLGGRLGLVLPAELLSVKYAANVRSFLLQRFSSVRLVLFEQLIFPGTLEDVVLLLADGFGGSANHFEVLQVRDGQDLLAKASGQFEWVGFRPKAEQKWTSALLPADSAFIYEEILKGQTFETMSRWGTTYLGAVTGNNNFFTLSASQASELGLPASDLLPISPPGSRHLRGVNFTEAGWKKLADADQRCYLFYPAEGRLSRGAKRYIDAGEAAGVSTAYKCAIRDPWWRVPLVDKPDLLLAYMNHDRPRFVKNSSGAHILNSLYGIRLQADRRQLGQDLLPIAALNSFSLLAAEMIGRSYGGGLLKHEPTEVSALPVPTKQVLMEIGPRLKLLASQIAAELRKQDQSGATSIVDKVLLRECLSFTDSQIHQIRSAREMFRQRRVQRARGTNAED